MSLTTPPRPADITVEFPQLASLARTATRLHPRPGPATPYDSSVGGPLRWPSSQPWPYCTRTHQAYFPNWPLTMADVRVLRELSVTRRGDTSRLTAREQEKVGRIRAVRDVADEPVAMLPVAQLYARDVTDLCPPAGADLLQVLWCPFYHEPWYIPETALFWRAAREVGEILADPPAPVLVETEGFVPEPCRLHPERIVEYPRQNYTDVPLEGIDRELSVDLDQWSADQHYEDRQDAFYSTQLSVAPGWKVGGWTPWSRTDPIELHCTECGGDMRPLLTLASREWADDSHSWIPYADRQRPSTGYPPPAAPTMVNIGDAEDLQLYLCTANSRHAHTARLP